MPGELEKYAIAMLISGGQTGVDRAALDFAMQNQGNAYLSNFLYKQG